MDIYFQPWRRRLGVLTLILASALMLGWVSLTSEPRFIKFPNSWAMIAMDQSVIVGPITPRSALPSSSYLDEPEESPNILVWNAAGKFDLTPVLTIPYYYVVIPLTLLAAWLLLGNLRQPKATTAPSV